MSAESETPHAAVVQPETDQPLKVAPWSGTALRPTWLPTGKELLQVAPQSMPEGSETTLPGPVVVTVSLAVGNGANVAVTAVLPVSFMPHWRPEQPWTLQLTRLEPA